MASAWKRIVHGWYIRGRRLLTGQVDGDDGESDGDEDKENDESDAQDELRRRPLLFPVLLLHGHTPLTVLVPRPFPVTHASRRVDGIAGSQNPDIGRSTREERALGDGGTMDWVGHAV